MDVLIHIEPFDRETATHGQWVALHEFRSRIRREEHPDDPPLSLDDMIRTYRSIPAFTEAQLWVATPARAAIAERSAGAPHDDAILALGLAGMPLTEENSHLVHLNLDVLPEWRRRGIGRRMLSAMIERVAARARTQWIAITHDRTPAGARFMEWLGARRGLESHTHQLVIADVDRELLRRWQVRAGERARDFELGEWIGDYPEHEMDEIVAMARMVNEVPRGDLPVEDFRWTAEHLRQHQAALRAQGIERWTLFVRDTRHASGDPRARRVVGYTEVFWTASKPEFVRQGATVVRNDYRNLGIGRWLKAAMLERLVHQRPQVRYVRTGNADSNAPMLRINQELGFRPYRSEVIWQGDVESVRARLAAS